MRCTMAAWLSNSGLKWHFEGLGVDSYFIKSKNEEAKKKKTAVMKMQKI